jgi:hypothetical protein
MIFMLNKNIYPLLALGFVLLAASCAKEGPNGAKGPVGPAGPTGANGPSFTGAISGHVKLYDQYGSAVLTGLNKVQVTLKGRSALAPDASGYYFFDTTKTGAFFLTATDSGFADTRLNNFQFVSDTLNKDIGLSAIPGFLLTSLSASRSLASASDSLSIKVIPDIRARRCIVFVNNAPNVGNAPANYLLAYIKAIPANDTVVTLLIPAQDLADAGLATNNKVYFAAYSYVVNDASVYEDLATGKSVYNAVNNPLIDSALAP